MTQYEAICEASNNAVRRWIEYRERSWNNLATIVRGLVAHCGVPSEKVFYLRSNGLAGEERRYREPEDQGRYTLPGAVTFEEDDGYWHLCVAMTLSRDGVFPVRWAGIVVCVSEDDCRRTFVKLGLDGKPRSIDFDDAAQCAALCDEIAKVLMQRFDNPRKIILGEQIGFTAVANPQEGEKEKDKGAASGR